MPRPGWYRSRRRLPGGPVLRAPQPPGRTSRAWTRPSVGRSEGPLGSSRASPTESRCVDGGIPEACELIRQGQERHRDAMHVERRDVRADEGAGDRDAAARQLLLHRPGGEVELQQVRRTQAVDDGEYPVAALEPQGRDQGADELAYQVVGAAEPHAGPSAFAVDADAELDLVRLEVERRSALARVRACLERKGQRPRSGDDILAKAGKLVQLRAGLR